MSGYHLIDDMIALAQTRCRWARGTSLRHRDRAKDQVMTEHDAPQGAGSEPPKGDDSTGRTREAAWDDVAAQFSNLGKQLRNRFDRPADESESAREGAGGETVRRWIDSLDETFTRLGDTVRDPAFRREAGSSVSQLGQALGVTLRELGEQLQTRFGRARGETTAGEDMPEVPPPPPTTPLDVPPSPPRSTPPASDVPPPPPTSTAPSSEVPPPPADPEPGTDAPDDPSTGERPPA
jgi:hypothetical protein